MTVESPRDSNVMKVLGPPIPSFVMQSTILRRPGVLLALLLCALSSTAWAQSDFQRVNTLEKRVNALEKASADPLLRGAILVLFGTVCALWAQSTRRNPGLWFVLGVVGSVLTILVLLYKNARDIASRAPAPADSG